MRLFSFQLVRVFKLLILIQTYCMFNISKKVFSSPPYNNKSENWVLSNNATNFSFYSRSLQLCSNSLVLEEILRKYLYYLFKVTHVMSL